MAFIIISNKDTELDRRPLTGGITVGRAPDCDLSVHDILLSRHHCRIEPSGRGWVVLDLKSKNGTWLDGERVGRRSLRHNELLRAGNTTIRFMTGDLSADPKEPALPKNKLRPADPFEALAGTVVDFDPGQIAESSEEPGARKNSRTPYPQPMPREPASYTQDGIYSLLEEIASSSWDSIYANASRPTRPPAEVAIASVGTAASATIERERPVKRPATPIRVRPLNAHKVARTTLIAPVRSRLQVDFSLQAPAIRIPRAVPRSLPASAPATPVPVSKPQAPKSQMRGLLRWVSRTLATARDRIAPRGFVMLF